MGQSQARRIALLEQRTRTQRAEIGQLRLQVERLTHERDAFEKALKEERIQHAATKKHLREVLAAIQTLSERHQNMLRRVFGQSSEHLAGKQEVLEACLDELDPETAQDVADALDLARDAAQSIATLSDEEPAAVALPQSEAEAEAQASAQAETTKKRHTRPAESGGRNELPEHLPRQTILYTPPPDHPHLHGAVAVKELRRRIISRLVIEPVHVVVHDLDCPVVRLTLANGIQTQQTLAPPAIYDRGQADDSVLIHTACDKVLDYLPCYRQSKRLERAGVQIHRSKLCRWHIALAHFLTDVASAILAEITTSAVIGIDDTIHRLLDTELHRCKNGRLWAVTDDNNTYYHFSETREGKWIDQLLGSYEGAVMGDAYAGHKVLLEKDQIIALFCWAHVRRKFFEATDCLQRQQALHLIGKLYEIEACIADHPPDQKVRERTQRAKPILAQFKQLLDAWQADKHILPKSAIGRATTYALNQWHGLDAYLTIGQAPIDNNRTERAMRPNALHRKNSLFSASANGARAYATLSTIIHTAHANGLNPYTYLTDIVKELHHRSRPASELTPAKYSQRLAAGDPAVKSQR